MNQAAILFVSVLLTVFALTVIALRILIPILRSKKAGQRILDIGPRWHKSKEGTPIMGGLAFILAILLVSAAFFIYKSTLGAASTLIPLALTLAFAVGNGAIGFVDDYCKLIKKQNEGLKVFQKLFLQIAVAAAYVCVMAYTGNFPTVWRIPFTQISLELGWFSYPLAILILGGVVNGANFTDGIDGLASSVTCVIGIFFAVIAFLSKDEQLTFQAALLIGATIGFLFYNFHPARIFMGDTGSLFLGAMVIGAAFMMRDPGVGLILSAVFIIEMLSSLLQVCYFKLTHGKRIFRMAPIHHHFECYGWKENKIVAVFSAVELVFCVIAYFAL